MTSSAAGGAVDVGKIFHDLGHPCTGNDARKGEMIVVPLNMEF